MISVLKHTTFKLLVVAILVILTSASCKSKKNIAKQPLTTIDTTVEKCRMEFKTGKALSKRKYDSCIL